MASVILGDVELAAEKLLSIFTKASKAAPSVLAAIGVLAAGVDKALSDVAAGAANPATLSVTLPSDVSDLKAVWPEVKTFLATLGIKL
jgi:thiamine monophosphate kinase